jgi:hypothetical protein
METKKKQKVRKPKKTKTKIFLIVLGLIVVLIVLAGLLAPVFVSSREGNRLILGKINNSIDGKVNFADLSMGWLKGIKIKDLSFNDNSGQISVQVKQLDTEPHYGSILAGNLSFGQTIVDTPKVQINLKEQKTSGVTPVKKPQKAPEKPRELSLAMNVDVKDGSLRITDPQSQTVEISQINSKVDLRPPGQETSFKMDMAVEGKEKQGTIQADGNIKPEKKGWTLKGTTGNLAVEVNDLDLESLGPFMALAGVDIQSKGTVRGNLNGEIVDGKLENLNTDINVKDLDISGPELKGDSIKTTNLDIDAKLNQKNELINIENLRVKSDWASIVASGVVPTTINTFGDFLKADSGYSLKGTFDCNLPAVMSQLPNTIGLKKGTMITSGRLNGDIETITQSGQKRIQANASINDLKGTVENKPVSLSEPLTAQALISSNKAGIEIDKLDLSSSFARINCNGSIEMINYNAEANLAKLQAELGQFVSFGKYQMAGEFLGKGNVSFKEKIAAAGSTQIDNLQITSSEGQSVSEPKASLDFAVQYDQKENLLAINNVKTETSFGSISVKDGVVPLNKKAAKSMNLVVNAADLDLAKIRPFAVMFASFPKEMQLAGIAESQIDVSSKGNIYDISSDSTNIKGLKFTYPERKPFESKEVSLIFNAEINPEEKAINVKKFQLDSPQIKIREGEFKLNSQNDKTKLEGQAELEYDWSAVTTVAAPYLPEGFTIQGKRQDTINFASEYPIGQSDKLMSNLTANAKIGFEKADYMGLNFGSTNVDIHVQNGLLKVAPFTTPVNDGQINFAVDIDFKQEKPALTIPQPISIKAVRINETVTGDLLKYVNPVFADAVGAKGVANFTAEQLKIPLSSSNKKDLMLIGTVGIDDIQLQPTGFLGQLITLMRVSNPRALMKLHQTNFTLKNGFVRYNNMQIDIGNNPVNFSGAIGLDKSLDMSVTLPYTTSGRTVRTGGENAYDRITLPLTGTIDKPKLDTSKFLQEQLKQQAEKEIQNLFEDLLK